MAMPRVPCAYLSWTNSVFLPFVSRNEINESRVVNPGQISGSPRLPGVGRDIFRVSPSSTPGQTLTIGNPGVLQCTQVQDPSLAFPIDIP